MDDTLQGRTTFTVLQMSPHRAIPQVKYGEPIYEQSDAMAMDSLLSPIVPNIFMKAFESTGILTSDQKPTV